MFIFFVPRTSVLERAQEGLKDQRHRSFFVGEVDGDGLDVALAEEPDDDFPLVFLALVGERHIGDPHARRQRAGLVPADRPDLSRHVVPGVPDHAPVEVHVQVMIDLLADRAGLEIPGRAGEVPDGGPHPVVRHGILDPRDGQQEDHPDEHDHDGDLDEGVTPLAGHCVLHSHFCAAGFLLDTAPLRVKLGRCEVRKLGEEAGIFLNAALPHFCSS